MKYWSQSRHRDLTSFKRIKSEYNVARSSVCSNALTSSVRLKRHFQESWCVGNCMKLIGCWRAAAANCKPSSQDFCSINQNPVKWHLLHNMIITQCDRPSVSLKLFTEVADWRSIYRARVHWAAADGARSTVYSGTAQMYSFEVLIFSDNTFHPKEKKNTGLLHVIAYFFTLCKSSHTSPPHLSRITQFVPSRLYILVHFFPSIMEIYVTIISKV